MKFGGMFNTRNFNDAGLIIKSGASEAEVTVGVESGGEAYFVMPPEITIEQVGSVIRLSW